MSYPFDSGDYIIPDRGRHPQDTLRVVEIDDDGTVKAYPLGGGFRMRFGPVDVARRAFRKVRPDEMDASFYPANFALDYMYDDIFPKGIPGWTAGYTWNGWATPSFELDVAEKVAAATDLGEFQYVTYLKDRDSFGVILHLPIPIETLQELRDSLDDLIQAEPPEYRPEPGRIYRASDARDPVLQARMDWHDLIKEVSDTFIKDHRLDPFLDQLNYPDMFSEAVIKFEDHVYTDPNDPESSLLIVEDWGPGKEIEIGEGIVVRVYSIGDGWIWSEI
jgi:hypothetical protein